MLQNVVNYLKDPARQERIALFVYFLIMGGLTLPLAGMMGRAWREYGVSRYLIEQAAINVLGIGLDAFTVVVMGIFFGLFVLLIIDPKKRWQGILLSFGTATSLFVIGSMGLIFPHIDIGHITWLVVGIAAGCLVGGIRQGFKKLQTSEALEFRGAAYTVFLLICSFTIISLLELHISYPNVFLGESGLITWEPEGLFINTAVSGVFIFSLWRFVNYDADESFFIIGPKQSGKTLLLTGAFLEAKESQRRKSQIGKTPLNPTPGLMQRVKELDSEQNGWGVEATGATETYFLEFQYVHGSIFPKNIQVTSVDYAGEYLQEIPGMLASDAEAGSPGGRGFGQQTDGGNPGSTQSEYGTESEYGEEEEEETEYGTESEYGEEEEEEETEYGTGSEYGGGEDSGGGDNEFGRMRGAVKLLRESDTIVFIIDTEKFLNNEGMGIEHYFSIIRHNKKKNAVLVATKSDLLAEEYRDERGLDPYNEFEDFKQYVNTRLQTNEQISTLVHETAGSEIYPVYYQTTENEEGELVPMRNESGSVITVGFDKLLKRLGQ
jgi:hypothetical protein